MNRGEGKNKLHHVIKYNFRTELSWLFFLFCHYILYTFDIIGLVDSASIESSLLTTDTPTYFYLSLPKSSNLVHTSINFNVLFNIASSHLNIGMLKGLFLLLGPVQHCRWSWLLHDVLQRTPGIIFNSKILISPNVISVSFCFSSVSTLPLSYPLLPVQRFPAILFFQLQKHLFPSVFLGGPRVSDRSY